MFITPVLVLQCRWQLCGSGAKRKTHQRVVKRLVGARKGREVSLNDSLEGWRAGGGRSVGASRKGHQRVAMTRWWLYGSGARWKVHQRVYNNSLVLEVAGRVSKTGQRVAMTRWLLCGSGAKRKTHQRVVKRLVGGREVVGVWVPVEKDTNESQ